MGWVGWEGIRQSFMGKSVLLEGLKYALIKNEAFNLCCLVHSISLSLSVSISLSLSLSLFIFSFSFSLHLFYLSIYLPVGPFSSSFQREFRQKPSNRKGLNPFKKMTKMKIFNNAQMFYLRHGANSAQWTVRPQVVRFTLCCNSFSTSHYKTVSCP